MWDKIYAFVFAVILMIIFIWDSNRTARFASFRQDGDAIYQSVATAKFGRSDVYTPECGTGTSVPVWLLAPVDGSITPSLFFPNENTASGITSYLSWYATINPSMCLASLQAFSWAFSKLSIQPNGLFLGNSTGSIFFGATYVDATGTIH